jgi:PadR family transcriptional regulator, regulatory protein PadR
MSFNRDLNKGSAELLVLTLLEGRPRHGYDIGKLIEERSNGQIRFRIGSLYPILFRLEDRGLIAGRWLEKDGERRRRCYRLTPAGRKFLQAQRSSWEEFVATVNRIVRPSYA